MTPAPGAASRVRSSWLLLFCFCFVSCNAPAPAPDWKEDVVVASSERVLWEVTVLALEKTGFPIGAQLEPAKLYATSGWMISLAPFRGKGFREQCEIHYTPESETSYRVQIRVRREKNDDLLHPLDVSYADWVPEPDNGERAQIVLQYIRGLLGTSSQAHKGKAKAKAAASKG